MASPSSRPERHRGCAAEAGFVPPQRMRLWECGSSTSVMCTTHHHLWTAQSRPPPSSASVPPASSCMARIVGSHETSSRLTIATYNRSSVSCSMPEGCGHRGMAEDPDRQDWACSPTQKYPDRCLSQSLNNLRSCLKAGRQARRSRIQSGGFCRFRGCS
jgi:hypothetical protein